jgi:hypothetical protein
MAINPNTNFSVSAVYTADQANRFPRGVVARAVSQTTYTLTTSGTAAIATGMTVTFTAEANRYYRITYYEPQAQTPSVVGNTQSYLKETSASGTIIGNAVFTNETNTTIQIPLTIIKTKTFTAGTVVLVGTGSVTSTSGTPTFIRDSTREALLLVEDIGPA